MAQYDLMTSPFKYMASACCNSCNVLQKPSSFPSSTCIVLLWGDYMYVILWVFFMKFPTQVREEHNHPVLSIYDRISSSHWSVPATILPDMCSSSISYILTAACMWMYCQYQVSVFVLQQKQNSRYIPTSFVYITMQNSPSCHDITKIILFLSLNFDLILHNST